jgi:hypothetical protein
MVNGEPCLIQPLHDESGYLGIILDQQYTHS